MGGGASLQNTPPRAGFPTWRKAIGHGLPAVTGPGKPRPL